MKAWLFTGAHEPLVAIDRPDPQPGTGEIVLVVRAAGLCHSDVGRMDGTLTPYLRKSPPLILGHEVAGVIAATGPDAGGYQIGDRVVASGNLDYCPGWSADGGYATHCLLPVASLVAIPDGVDFVQAAAATDAGQTSHSAVVDAGGARPGLRMGIVGLGGLGMTGARIAVLHGAAVHAAEPRREAWEVAKTQGVLTVTDDVRGLAEHSLDVIVDFAGFGHTTAGAIEAVRPGGLVVQVGLGRTQATISTMALVGKAVTLRGSAGGRAVNTAAVLALMAQGGLVIPASTIGFEDIPEGLARLERGGVIGRIVAEIGG